MKLRNIYSNIKFLLKIYLKYGKVPFVLSLMQGLFYSTVIVYIEVNMVKFIIDELMENKEIVNILFIIIIFLIIQLFNIVLSQFLKFYIREFFSLKINTNINMYIYEKAMKTDYKYLDDPSFYDNYQWTLERLSGQANRIAQFIIKNITSVIRITMLMALIGATEPIIIILSITSVALTSLLYKIATKINYKKEEDSLKINRSQGYIQRLFYLKEFAFDLRSTGFSNIFLNNYIKNYNKLLAVINKYKKKIFSIDSIRMSIGMFFYMGSICYLSYCVSTNTISIGTFSAMLVAFNMLRSSIGDIADELIELQKIGLYTNKIMDFINVKSVIENDDDDKSRLNITKKPFHIKLDNVSFKYNDESLYILKDINMEIKPGQKIAIVGENGTGKTTLVKLLLRYYDANTGKINFNGENIKTINLSSLRKNIGIAFQQSHAYATSLRNNMNIYNDSIEDNELLNILKKTNLDKNINKNKNILDIEVTKEFSEDGLELSGGQTQILAISRLFFKEFGLIILDEPSSALDPLMEYELNNIIMKEFTETTVIIISHRLSTVRNFDCINLLHDGKIVESGTHDELIARNGRYYTMFSKQAENYI